MLHNAQPLDLGVVLCSRCQKTSHGVFLFPGVGEGVGVEVSLSCSGRSHGIVEDWPGQLMLKMTLDLGFRRLRCSEFQAKGDFGVNRPFCLGCRVCAGSQREARLTR